MKAYQQYVIETSHQSAGLKSRRSDALDPNPIEGILSHQGARSYAAHARF